LTVVPVNQELGKVEINALYLYVYKNKHNFKINVKNCVSCVASSVAGEKVNLFEKLNGDKN